ncbi:MAG: translation initiation factor IF-2 [Thermodesulfobacteriota bacterium]
MAKIRIYELAQRLGLGNKDLLKRLRDKGVEAKSHMSVVDEETVREFEGNATGSGAEQQESIAEERISSGLIRRRRKPQPPKEKVEEAEPAAESSQDEKVDDVVDSRPSSSAADADQISSRTKPEDRISADEHVQTSAAADAEKKKPDTGSAPAAEDADAGKGSAQQEVESEDQDDVKPSAPEAAAPVKRTAPTRHVASIVTDDKADQAPQKTSTKTGAKILGHVELPKSAMRQDQRGGRKSGPGDKRKTQGGGRPTAGARPESAPAGGSKAPGPKSPTSKAPGSKTPAFVDVPVDPDSDKGRDQRRRKKKSKGANEHADGFGGKKRERVEVYKPDRMGRNRKGKKNQQSARQTEITVPKAIKRKIRISDVITVGELAKRMGVKANDLIKELMRQGSMVTINHPLDFESAAILAADFNYEVENVAFDEESVLGNDDDISVEDNSASTNAIERPPVVTIMGHVDHGKTSLLDAIRSAHIADAEAGGITQHIGAYDVQVNDKTISFLDTPGHEAFTAMRSRGAQVTDIVILVVAADDGVMPQTREAISHSKAAGVPIIVAVNKMDKPGANPERVKQELTEFELVPEDWGGDTIFVEVSAKQRTNLEGLLEMVLLQAEVLDLKADPAKRCRGTIVEARLDKGRGAVATVLVQDGTLKIGDPIVAGLHQGRVRTMINDRGEQVKEAGPSIPVEVTGLQGVPEAGDTMNAVESEKLSKEVAQHRQHKSREAELAKSSRLSLDQLYARIQEGNVEELKVIIKADVQGSVEALKEALVKLTTDTCRLTVVHTAVGGIKESDVSLAAASDAIIIGFSVRPEPKAAAMAEKEGVDIRLYSIIYDAVADVRSAMEGLLAPTLKEKYLGRIEVRETFHVSKVGTIAGCIVQDGIARRNSLARLIRDNVVVWEGTLSSLKRFKEDAKEVKAGYECGIGLQRYNDIKVGDVIETYEIIETKTEL